MCAILSVPRVAVVWSSSIAKRGVEPADEWKQGLELTRQQAGQLGTDDVGVLERATARE